MTIVGSTWNDSADSMLTVAAIELSLTIVAARPAGGEDYNDYAATIQPLSRLYYGKTQGSGCNDYNDCRFDLCRLSGL